ncbi:hypothetical protein B0H19DRAFT_1077872 [Mycena capillaripes]|nr:hypothetical protein B0H19DRAFT_1077872 [Mycena capillaripes]
MGVSDWKRHPARGSDIYLSHDKGYVPHNDLLSLVPEKAKGTHAFRGTAASSRKEKSPSPDWDEEQLEKDFAAANDDRSAHSQRSPNDNFLIHTPSSHITIIENKNESSLCTKFSDRCMAAGCSIPVDLNVTWLPVEMLSITWNHLILASFPATRVVKMEITDPHSKRITILWLT